MTNKGGRPKKEIEQRLFEELCSIQCTKDEICAVIDCDEKTLTRWCHDTYGKGFSDTYKKYSEHGKRSLRRILFDHASKNVTAAIWLSKQYLGMTDKNEVTNITPDTEIKIEIINDKNKLKNES